MVEDFLAWLDAHEGDEWHWYAKRLAANDTLATKSHQAGPYIPNGHAFFLFPSLEKLAEDNPKIVFRGKIDSHQMPERELVITWYRAAKNECRITRWGGLSSPILDPETTGSVVVFAFRKTAGSDADFLAAWVCNIAEENILVERIGPIEPGVPLLLSRLAAKLPRPSLRSSCALAQEDIPPAWLTQFPTGSEIVEKCIELRRLPLDTVDNRLLRRRDCEYEIFKSIENLHVLPRLLQGFSSVDEFMAYSHAVNNRRKSRAGRSLELHVREIFVEEDVPHCHGCESEPNKRPDFLIPSAESYQANKNPLWMLAVKTTCKDRWRQILNEADLIPRKHLLTLQEGVSINQFAEMENAGLTLVVPAGLQGTYPAAIRHKLLSLSAFIDLVKVSLSHECTVVVP